MKELAEKHRTKQLPSYESYDALEELISRFQGRWRESTGVLIDTVVAELETMATQHIKSKFGRFPEAGRKISALADDLQDKLRTELKQHVDNKISMEEVIPFTLNVEFVVLKDRLTSTLQGSLGGVDVHKMDETAVAGVKMHLRELQIKGVGETDLLKLCKVNEHVVAMVAGTLAYYKISANRVIDEVPMYISHYLLSRFAKELSRHLTTQLQVWSTVQDDEQGEGGIDALLAEDQSLAMQRSSLEQQQEKLQQIHRDLRTC